MTLLKHGTFEFEKILSGGFRIKEDEPEIISEVKMADGSKKRNYGDKPQTWIKVKFSDLDKKEYEEYMSHFEQNEDVYSYFSPKNQKELTKKFFVKLPEISMIYASDTEQLYDEFEVELEQCGEVSE